MCTDRTKIYLVTIGRDEAQVGRAKRKESFGEINELRKEERGSKTSRVTDSHTCLWRPRLSRVPLSEEEITQRVAAKCFLETNGFVG